MFSIYLNDEMELIGRHGDLYADYIVPKELRVRDLCVKTFNYYRMESECTLVCANGRVPNGDGNRIPTVKLKIPGKLLLKWNPEFLLHSSYSF